MIYINIPITVQNIGVTKKIIITKINIINIKLIKRGIKAMHNAAKCLYFK